MDHNILERVPKIATGQVCEFSNIPYSQSLIGLTMYQPEACRKITDLLLWFYLISIIQHMFFMNPRLNTSRGHSKKLARNVVMHRVVILRVNLPQEVIEEQNRATVF